MKAFPDPLRGGNQAQYNQEPDKEESGMDLRDYFAAKAMQGLLSSVSAAFAKEISNKAYVMADAMLEAREAKNEQ